MIDGYLVFAPVVGGLIGAWIAWNSKPTLNPVTFAKPLSDFDILARFAELMETGMHQDAFYDVSLLPYPKRRLMAAAEAVFVSPETPDEYCQFLIVALHVLPLFRVGIGPKPVYWFGIETTLWQKVTPNYQDVQHEIHQLAAHNEIWRPIVERLQAEAKLEHEEIDRQIKALEHLRATRAQWQAAAEHIVDLTPPRLSAASKAKPVINKKIVADFSKFTADSALDFSRIYDISILPYPKRRIFEAVTASLSSCSPNDGVDGLAMLLEWLSHFQSGVGSAEIHDIEGDDETGLKVKRIIEARWRDREHYDQIMEPWFGGMRVFYSRGGVTKMA